MTERERMSGNLSLRLPLSLMEQLEGISVQTAVSLSDVARLAISRGLPGLHDSIEQAIADAEEAGGSPITPATPR